MGDPRPRQQIAWAFQWARDRVDRQLRSDYLSPGWDATRLHRKGGDARSATLRLEINTTQRPFNLVPANQA